MRGWPLLLMACAPTHADLLARNAEQPGWLAFTCDPVDADLWLDGVGQGTCADYPKGLKLSDGMHHVEVKKPGFAPYQTYVDSSGTRAALTIKLLPNP